MPAFHSVVSVLVRFAVRSSSTNSRPALRAASGRPPARRRHDPYQGAGLISRQVILPADGHPPDMPAPRGTCEHQGNSLAKPVVEAAMLGLNDFLATPLARQMEASEM